MLKAPRVHYVRLLAAVVAVTSLAACSGGGGCGTCAVPNFHLPTTPTGTLSCAQNAIQGQGVPLGSAATFAVLGGSTVTNTNTPTIVTGDLGVSPGSAVTGFPPGIVTGGSIHAADATAATAQNDLTTAYNNAAGRVGWILKNGEIGGQTLAPGLYKADTSMQITGTVTLDGQNNPNNVFIFQIGSTLTTGSGAAVVLINQAGACNVFWQVGSSATLGVGTAFNGNILALTSITANTGASVNGRLLARNGAVSLDNNAVTRPPP